MTSSLLKSTDKESIWILDKYLCNQIEIIPRPLRFKIIDRFEYNAQSFIESCRKNFLQNSGGVLSIEDPDYEEAANLYETMIAYKEALESEDISKMNFDVRCELLSGVVPMKADDIKKYLCANPFNFSFCSCIYDLIFNKMEFGELKRGILEHYSGYSNKYEKLTQRELARRAKVTFHAVGSAYNFMERRLSEAIRYFRVLAPYYSYESKFRLDKDLLIISPEDLNRIRREEGAEEMTDKFIAKAAGVIFDKKVQIKKSCVKEDRLGQQRDNNQEYAHPIWKAVSLDEL